MGSSRLLVAWSDAVARPTASSPDSGRRAAPAPSAQVGLVHVTEERQGDRTTVAGAWLRTGGCAARPGACNAHGDCRRVRGAGYFGEAPIPVDATPHFVV